MKLLIIEDEETLLKSIATYFRQDGEVCETASSYEVGLEKIAMYAYDCIILDIGLPDGSGLDLVKKLKDLEIESGVIIISANGELETKIASLNLGSDDYLTKPFHLSELNARVKAIVRRKQFRGNHLLAVDGISIDLDERKVLVKEKEVKLTKLEYKLLLYLISNRNRVITKNSIAEHLWGDYMDYADSYDFIYSHMKNLRKKLIETGSFDYIKTIYGVGYKFVAS